MSAAAPVVEASPRLGPDRTGYIAIVAPIVNPVRDAFIREFALDIGPRAAVSVVMVSSVACPWSGQLPS